MKLAWILWLSQVLPQPAADSLCLSTTVYLEARDQSVRGQQAVAEVALRRRDSGLWGDNLCAVVTARKQFAPTLVSAGHPPAATPKPGRRRSPSRSKPNATGRCRAGERKEIVPGASHFAAHAIASPAGATPTRWRRSATTPSIACSRSSRARLTRGDA